MVIDMNDLNDEVSNQQLIDEELTLTYTAAEKALEVANEALVDVYSVGYSLTKDGIGLEDNSGSKNIFAKMAEKIREFFKWIKSVIAKMINYLKNKSDDKKDIVSEIKEFENKYRGKDKILLLENKSSIASEDFSNTDALQTHEVSSELRALTSARATYIARKTALWRATESICSGKGYLTSLFAQKKQLSKEYETIFTYIDKDLTKLITDTFSSVSKSRSLTDMTEMIMAAKIEYKEQLYKQIQSSDIQKDLAATLKNMGETVAFNQVSPEDLIPVIGQVLWVTSSTDNQLIESLSLIEKIMKEFKEYDAIRHSQHEFSDESDKVIADYYQALAILQKMASGLVGALNIIRQSIAIPDSYYDLTRSAMNAYESVVDLLNRLKANELDDEAKSLYAQMTKEFI